MRMIGQLGSEEAAKTFSEFLYVQGIPNQIERDGAAWDIWVHSDDDLSRATQFLNEYRLAPTDARFKVGDQAAERREQEKEDRERVEKRIKDGRDIFRPIVAYGFGKLTALLMAISVTVFLVSKLSYDLDQVRMLFFSEVYPQHKFLARFNDMPEIRSGEIWRLITPIFIHMGFIHIFFNMLWLRDLGSMIESREGAGRLLGIVMVTAVGSNLAEYIFNSPAFGGMSGVVYGLFGYIWMKSKYDIAAGLYLHRSTVTMMLIWLVVCYTGAIGRVANYAHTGGLLIGMAFGFVASQWRRR